MAFASGKLDSRYITKQENILRVHFFSEIFHQSPYSNFIPAVIFSAHIFSAFSNLPEARNVYKSAHIISLHPGSPSSQQPSFLAHLSSSAQLKHSTLTTTVHKLSRKSSPRSKWAFVLAVKCNAAPEYVWGAVQTLEERLKPSITLENWRRTSRPISIGCLSALLQDQLPLLPQAATCTHPGHPHQDYLPTGT